MAMPAGSSATALRSSSASSTWTGACSTNLAKRPSPLDERRNQVLVRSPHRSRIQRGKGTGQQHHLHLEQIVASEGGAEGKGRHCRRQQHA